MACSVLGVSGLFEDQAAGKFDWKQSYVGNMRQLGFQINSITSLLVVATDSNGVAELDADYGGIMWRNAFKSDEIGKVWDRCAGKMGRRTRNWNCLTTFSDYT